MKRKEQLQLDKKDRTLLYLLDVNGRMNFAELARRTGMSKQRAQYRVERLEKEGFIKGYYAMIDTSRLGFTTFRVYLKFRNLVPEKQQEISEYLTSQKQVWAVVRIAGKWDVALGIAVEDIYQFYDVWDALLTRYLAYVKDYKISVYSPIYHFTKAYLLGKEDSTKIRILGGKGKAKIDAKDMVLLLALSKNARTSLIELAHNVKMTPEAISHRLKKLEKEGIIQGYRAMIDVTKLGYEFYKTEIRLARYDAIKQITEFCHRHPNIYQIDKTIGGETIEIEFHVRSLQEMLTIIGELEKQFPNTIESFDYITVLSEEKTTYMPELST